MNLQTLLNDIEIIRFHGEEHGTNLYLDAATLRSLDRQLERGMRTIETGAGVSTIVFALHGTEHTCIVPDQRQVERIQRYCAQHDLSLSTTQFIIDKSENVLPNLPDLNYDVALIDGSHGFPLPFLDWFYIARKLKPGGIIIIDDLHIWTCDLLTRFLEMETNWSVLDETNRYAVFRKEQAKGPEQEWTHQPYVTQRSRATSLRGKFDYGRRLLLNRKFGILWQDFAAKLKREAEKR